MSSVLENKIAKTIKIKATKFAPEKAIDSHSPEFLYDSVSTNTHAWIPSPTTELITPKLAHIYAFIHKHSIYYEASDSHKLLLLSKKVAIVPRAPSRSDNESPERHMPKSRLSVDWYLACK